MALVLNEEQSMLREAASGFLAEKAPVSALRELRDGAGELGYDPALWREMAAMGWAGIAIAEAYGGLDYGYVGLGVVLEQMGRNLSVSPLQSSILVCATAISRMGNEAQKEALLPGLAGGELRMALALQEGPHHAPHETALKAVPAPRGFELSGRKVAVIDAHVADKYIVAARTAGAAGEDEGITLFLVDADAPGLTRERVIMVDSRNSGNIMLDEVAVGADDILGDLHGAYGPLQAVLDIANIGLAAELLGLSREAFERTMEYLKQRKQFGEYIGTFQALQHRAARMYAELELSRSLVVKALQAIDAGGKDLSSLASACKARLCETAALVTGEAIQMHGGIGMTDEFDIGFFIKRARVARQTFGDYNYHLDRFARLNGY